MRRFCKSLAKPRTIQWTSEPVSTFLVSWFCCVLFLFAALGEADAAETKISTLSLAPIPKGATIEIRLPVEEGSDDLKLAIILADHFSALLEELGHTIVEADGELLFRFAAEEPTYARREDLDRHAGIASDRGRLERLPAESHSITLVSLAARSKNDHDTYRLRVSVARARRPPLWTGYIERSVTGAERQATYARMADALLAYWGQTYSNPR